MSNSKSSLFVAVLSAVGASLCCITPFVASLAGIAGGAGAFSFLEPARPYLGIVTASLLGFSFYNVYKKEKRHNCCTPAENEKKSFLKSKMFVWLIAVFAVLLYTFPYYQGIFLRTNPIRTNAAVNEKYIQTMDLKIEGMTCTGCENHIESALSEQEGVIDSDANYEKGNVIIKFSPDEISEERIVLAINKTGYTVKK